MVRVKNFGSTEDGMRTIPGVNSGLHAGSSCWVNLESAHIEKLHSIAETCMHQSPKTYIIGHMTFEILLNFDSNC